MRRTVAIGEQNFARLVEEELFYVDKTKFIREWWDAGDSVTLITRPRRFGKTLTLSMVERFFTLEQGKQNPFEGLEIWKEERFRRLYGTYPVIFLSFAPVKENNYEEAREHIFAVISELYQHFSFVWEGKAQTVSVRHFLNCEYEGVSNVMLSCSLRELSRALSRYYGKQVLILLDEYDTPMQEAYVFGYWEKMVAFMRVLFHETLKCNSYLHRALLTGITRVSRESMFSDLNHLEIVSTTSKKYEDIFGFTEEEVFRALDEYGLSERRDEVKFWYDGFVFGEKKDIYNPWSISHYLDSGKAAPYWMNSSANSLVGQLIRTGSRELQEDFATLLAGGTLIKKLDEQIVFGELKGDSASVWSLLLASGYLKAVRTFVPEGEEEGELFYELAKTNYEIHLLFRKLVSGWFAPVSGDYNGFVKALLRNDVSEMNSYMNLRGLQRSGFESTGLPLRGSR